MKRQQTLRSSSSRKEAGGGDNRTTVHHAASSIGCMAGVFQLISSKYRTRRRFLTFGKKQQEKETVMTASSGRVKPKSPARSKAENGDRFGNDVVEDSREFRRFSCEVQRSPIVPPEIRRSKSLNSPETFRSPVTSVVARLMGLEEEPATVTPVAETPSPPQTPESATEKRRKLLGALEKCDEDLQALKRIIEAVRSSDRPKTTAPPSVSVGKSGRTAAIKKCTDQLNSVVEQEQPSPVSVLEDFTESPPPSFTGEWNSSARARIDMCRQEPKKPREGSMETASFSINIHHRWHEPPPVHPKSHHAATRSPPRTGGGTMERAVSEVCKEVEMGQRREIERIGILVEDFIYRDLIEETTKGLMGRCHVYSSLPFEKCKRKLGF